MMNKILLIMGGLMVTFAVGYLPQAMNVGRLTTELEESSIRYENQLGELRESNRLLGLQRDLGMLLMEVEDQNYGRARDRSTIWFDELAAAATTASSDDSRQTLAALSGRRDVLTMMLTEANPDAAAQVRDMYRVLTTVTLTD